MPNPLPGSGVSRFARLRSAQHPRCVICSAANPPGLGLRIKLQPEGSVAAGSAGSGGHWTMPPCLAPALLRAGVSRVAGRWLVASAVPPDPHAPPGGYQLRGGADAGSGGTGSAAAPDARLGIGASQHCVAPGRLPGALPSSAFPALSPSRPGGGHEVAAGGPRHFTEPCPFRWETSLVCRVRVSSHEKEAQSSLM